MDEEELSEQPPETSWCISPDWFEQNNRSLSTLIRDRLCSKCITKLKDKKKAESTDAVFSVIRECYSHTPDFVNDRLPILESIFRLFLANGNQPMRIEEMGKELNRMRGVDLYRTTPENLRRLLKSDRYYGLRETENQ
jgi:hypothetical protein